MRAYLRTFWKLATLLLTLVTCLLAHGTPALAISSYSAAAEGFFTSFGLNPPGTDLIVSLAAGSVSVPPPIQIGNASATGGGGTVPTATPFQPSAGSARAQVSGFASAPPDSFASSFASAVHPTVLVNHNTTTAAFPLLLFPSAVSRTTLGQERLASAQAHASLRLLFDGTVLLDDTDGLVTAFVPFTTPDPFSLLLTIPLTPGFHSLLLEVEAHGFASETVPEPTTLLLFGTTAAGLGLARWYRRRGRDHEHAA